MPREDYTKPNPLDKLKILTLEDHKINAALQIYNEIKGEGNLDFAQHAVRNYSIDTRQNFGSYARSEEEALRINTEKAISRDSKEYPEIKDFVQEYITRQQSKSKSAEESRFSYSQVARSSSSETAYPPSPLGAEARSAPSIPDAPKPPKTRKTIKLPVEFEISRDTATNLRNRLEDSKTPDPRASYAPQNVRKQKGQTR